MKKLMLSIAVLGFFTYAMTSCGGKQEKEAESGEESYNAYETAPAEEEEPQEASVEDLIKQGQALLDQNDCKTCHHATDKLIGPAHTEVAKKYEFTQANVTYLADKIVNGGSGVWGEIPMTPHVSLSQADAEKLAIYVLSLDGEEPKL